MENLNQQKFCSSDSNSREKKLLSVSITAYTIQQWVLDATVQWHSWWGLGISNWIPTASYGLSILLLRKFLANFFLHATIFAVFSSVWRPFTM